MVVSTSTGVAAKKPSQKGTPGESRGLVVLAVERLWCRRPGFDSLSDSIGNAGANADARAAPAARQSELSTTRELEDFFYRLTPAAG